MNNLLAIFGAFAVFAGLITLTVVVGLILALPVMLLWDWLMPGIFGLRTITWLEAWGLLVMCGLLFKSHTPTKE